MSPGKSTVKPLLPPPGPPPRRTGLELPPYRHLPGSTPHPLTDPKGHSYARREEPIELGERVLPEDWREVEEYLYGIDLFNRAFLWESHEAWEAVWHAVEGDRLVAGYVQGLIQVAAALLQHHLGRRRGVRNLWRKSAANQAAALDRLAEQDAERFMGIELAAWRRRVERYLDESGPYPFLELSA